MANLLGKIVRIRTDTRIGTTMWSAPDVVWTKEKQNFTAGSLAIVVYHDAYQGYVRLHIHGYAGISKCGNWAFFPGWLDVLSADELDHINAETKLELNAAYARSRAPPAIKRQCRHAKNMAVMQRRLKRVLQRAKTQHAATRKALVAMDRLVAKLTADQAVSAQKK